MSVDLPLKRCREREREGEGEGERERDPNKPTNTQLHFGWFEEVVIKYPRRILLKRDG